MPIDTSGLSGLNALTGLVTNTLATAPADTATVNPPPLSSSSAVVDSLVPPSSGTTPPGNGVLTVLPIAADPVSAYAPGTAATPSNINADAQDMIALFGAAADDGAAAAVLSGLNAALALPAGEDRDRVVQSWTQLGASVQQNLGLARKANVSDATAPASHDSATTLVSDASPASDAMTSGAGVEIIPTGYAFAGGQYYRLNPIAGDPRNVLTQSQAAYEFGWDNPEHYLPSQTPAAAPTSTYGTDAQGNIGPVTDPQFRFGVHQAQTGAAMLAQQQAVAAFPNGSVTAWAIDGDGSATLAASTVRSGATTVAAATRNTDAPESDSASSMSDELPTLSRDSAAADKDGSSGAQSVPADYGYANGQYYRLNPIAGDPHNVLTPAQAAYQFGWENPEQYLPEQTHAAPPTPTYGVDEQGNIGPVREPQYQFGVAQERRGAAMLAQQQAVAAFPSNAFTAWTIDGDGGVTNAANAEGSNAAGDAAATRRASMRSSATASTTSGAPSTPSGHSAPADRVGSATGQRVPAGYGFANGQYYRLSPIAGDPSNVLTPSQAAYRFGWDNPERYLPALTRPAPSTPTYGTDAQGNIGSVKAPEYRFGVAQARAGAAMLAQQQAVAAFPNGPVSAWSIDGDGNVDGPIGSGEAGH